MPPCVRFVSFFKLGTGWCCESFVFLASGCFFWMLTLVDFRLVTGKFLNALGWAQYGKGGKGELIQTFCEGNGVVPKGGEAPPPPVVEAEENDKKEEEEQS